MYLDIDVLYTYIRLMCNISGLILVSSDFSVRFRDFHLVVSDDAGDKTDNYMGASEMLMSTGMSGIIFALFGGQPLLITGFTGPNMVFEEGVYKVS